MTREEIEKLPVIIAMMLSESVTAHTNEKIHEKITEVCNLAIKALDQEPKPMVEIDLYSVIKQKYIERDVLDKLRAEIETKYGQCDICEYDAISGWEQVSDIADILQIIDKYKAESEVKK